MRKVLAAWPSGRSTSRPQLLLGSGKVRLVAHTKPTRFAGRGAFEASSSRANRCRHASTFSGSARRYGTAAGADETVVPKRWGRLRSGRGGAKGAAGGAGGGGPPRIGPAAAPATAGTTIAAPSK